MTFMISLRSKHVVKSYMILLTYSGNFNFTEISQFDLFLCNKSLD